MYSTVPKLLSDDYVSAYWLLLKKNGYKVNMVARGLKSGYTNTLSVIVPSITHVFFPLAYEVCSKQQHKRAILLAFMNPRNPAVERRCIELLKNQWVDGIVLGTCIPPEDEDYSGRKPP
jgi:DNA-binding LacI/PurR family transcriptional regulator